MKYSYLAEKLSAARRCLMLPHPKGEADSIFHAFHECKLGLMGIDINSLDETPRDWIKKLDKLMSTAGLEDPSKRGLWLIKAEQLSTDDKIELSHVIDELAFWFHQKE